MMNYWFLENQIGKYSKEGQLIGSIDLLGLDESFNDLSGLVLDSQGNLFIGNGENEQIVVFDRFDRFISGFGQVSGYSSFIAIDSFDRISFGIDNDETNSCCINFYDSIDELRMKFGKEGKEIGQFNGPRGLCFDSEDNLVVCECKNNRIQVITAPY